jgi:hypothetical protein
LWTIFEWEKSQVKLSAYRLLDYMHGRSCRAFLLYRILSALISFPEVKIFVPKVSVQSVIAALLRKATKN